MLEALTVESFAPHVGDVFLLREDEGTLELRLTRATPFGAQMRDGRRAPFAIEFSGPIEPILPQHVYRLEHETLGTIDIFIVPLAPEGGGARYEAVFN